jgi:hypothetical protein
MPGRRKGRWDAIYTLIAAAEEAGNMKIFVDNVTRIS